MNDMRVSGWGKRLCLVCGARLGENLRHLEPAVRLGFDANQGNSTATVIFNPDGTVSGYPEGTSWSYTNRSPIG